MEVISTPLKDCYVLKPKQIEDQRGVFAETYQKQLLEEKTGFKNEFVQDNQSSSKANVLRGFHIQQGAFAQTKLVRVVQGKVWDVVVDVRKNSPSFLKHFALEISAENQLQLLIPRGFLHAFLSLEDQSIFCYKCDAYYHKASESGVRFDDSSLAIDWPISKGRMILSEKDQELLSLEDFLKQQQ
ncbi:MAG: dTDP-4-dehydrorhamnose 3,5-epimerase [Flavobacteriaceae bacterium]|nr:dTDP-4-dehydrorhamnose 3,5-epimerase [Flavobacteriaceae bacterium]